MGFGATRGLILRYLKLFGDKNELGNLRRKTSAKISSLFKGKEEKIWERAWWWGNLLPCHFSKPKIILKTNKFELFIELVWVPKKEKYFIFFFSLLFPTYHENPRERIIFQSSRTNIRSRYQRLKASSFKQYVCKGSRQNSIVTLGKNVALVIRSFCIFILHFSTAFLWMGLFLCRKVGERLWLLESCRGKCGKYGFWETGGRKKQEGD